jgi:hypothetical protein
VTQGEKEAFFPVGQGDEVGASSRTAPRLGEPHGQDDDIQGVNVTNAQLSLFHDEATVSRTVSDKVTDARLRRAYGITLVQYEAMVKEQGGCCAICQRPNWQALAVDHSHVTGVVRRLLCHACNMALGQFEGSVERIETALSYLRAHGED